MSVWISTSAPSSSDALLKTLEWGPLESALIHTACILQSRVFVLARMFPFNSLYRMEAVKGMR